MSTKGLTKLNGGTYREHIEGWTCDYCRQTQWDHGKAPPKYGPGRHGQDAGASWAMG